MMNPATRQENEIVLFIGSEKLAAFEGSVLNGEAKIVKFEVSEDRDGFEKGFVRSLDKAAFAIEGLLKKLNGGALPGEETAIHVVLGNAKLRTYTYSSSLYFQGFNRTITHQEIRTVVQQTRSIATLPLSEFVLQAIPESFLVDDLAGVRNPVGLEARRLGVTLKISTMNFEDFKNIVRALEAADVNVKGYYPQTLTAASAVLSDTEKEEGALLFDIHENAIFLTVWKKGLMKASRVLDIAGRQLSALIASKWGIELHDARKVKDQYGSFELDNNFKEELIPLVERGEKGVYSIHRQEFQENFLQFAGEWIAEIIRQSDLLCAEEKVNHPHCVFTGEGVLMNGFLEFLQAKFSRPGRIGFSKKIEMPDALLKDPSMSAGTGLFRWLADSMEDQRQMLSPRGFLEKTLVSAKGWFATYF